MIRLSFILFLFLKFACCGVAGMVVLKKDQRVISGTIISRNDKFVEMILEGRGTRIKTPVSKILQDDAETTLSARILLGDQFMKDGEYVKAIRIYKEEIKTAPAVVTARFFNAERDWKKDIIRRIENLPVEEQEKSLLKMTESMPEAKVPQAVLKDILFERGARAVDTLNPEAMTDYLNRAIKLSMVHEDIRLHHHGFDDGMAMEFIRMAWDHPDNQRRREDALITNWDYIVERTLLNEQDRARIIEKWKDLRKERQADARSSRLKGKDKDATEEDKLKK
jgi:hypothetical protein